MPSCHPQPGDLIEISRKGKGFQHWAICIGGGKVVHLTSDGASMGVSSGYSSSKAIAVVKREPLDKVAGNDHWCINNNADKKLRPFPIRQIKKLANAMVGRTVYYSVTQANCEHFVHLLRYGKKRSNQVVKACIASGIFMSIIKVKFLLVIGSWFTIRKFYRAIKRKCLKTMEDEYKSALPYLSLKRGYLIRIFQNGYELWAMYVGTGEVIYLCQASSGYVIKREHLAKVATSDQWKIDNSWDDRMEPLPKDKIIKNADAMIQHKIKRNGKDFVKLIRYFEMPNSDPKPGDVITILRPRFNQWAIYIGDGDIIYPDSDGSTAIAGHMVVRKPLAEVAASDLWCVNNKLDSSMKPLCAKEIIRNAQAMIGKEIKSSEEEFIRRIRYVKKVGVFSAIKKKGTNGTNTTGFAVFKIVIYTIVIAVGISMLLSAAGILDVSF